MDLLSAKRKLLPLGNPQDSGGGGGGGQTSSQTQTTDLPEWARPYAKDILSKGAALTDINKNPYQQYGAERIAGFQPLQEQAFKTVGGMDAGPQAFQSQIGSYMSPYMQNVVDVEKREAARQSGIMGTQQQAQATQAGAFGGARDAIARAERERNLSQRMEDIQARGSQAAYEQAANQFRQGITQQSGLAQLQGTLGAQQQQQAQRPLDVAYQDFLNQQNYPYKQLGFMSDLLKGTPTGSSSTVNMYQPAGSTLGQLGGLGMGLYGMSRMFADGGEVDSYADGGVTSQGNVDNILSKLSDQQLAAAREAALNRRDINQVQMIDSEIAERASLRNGLGNAFDQIPAPQQEAMMANGGMVAFADGDVVSDPMGTGVSEILDVPYQPTGTSGLQKAWSRLQNEPEWKIKAADEAALKAAQKAVETKKPAAEKKPANKLTNEQIIARNAAIKNEGRQIDLSGADVTPKATAPARGKAVAKADGAGAKSISSALPDAAKEVIPAIAQKTGVPEDDLMALYPKLKKMLDDQAAPLIERQRQMVEGFKPNTDAMKKQGLAQALTQFGFKWAQEASKPGSKFLGSAATASPEISSAAQEMNKLINAKQENYQKMQMDQAKYEDSLYLGNMKDATILANQIRQSKQLDKQLDMQAQQLQAQIAHQREIEWQGRRGLEIQSAQVRAASAGRETVSGLAQQLMKDPSFKGTQNDALMQAANMLKGGIGAGIRADASKVIALENNLTKLEDKYPAAIRSGKTPYAKEQQRLYDLAVQRAYATAGLEYPGAGGISSAVPGDASSGQWGNFRVKQ